MTTTALIVAARNKAEVAACKLIINGFDSGSASVDQMQEYARCIDKIYPTNLSYNELISLKILLVFFIFSFLFGIWKESRGINFRESFSDIFFGGFVYSVMLTAVAVVAVFVFYGIFLLFN